MMLLDIPEERSGDLDLRWGEPKDCRFPLFPLIKPLSLARMGLVYGLMWLGKKLFLLILHLVIIFSSTAENIFYVRNFNVGTSLLKDDMTFVQMEEMFIVGGRKFPENQFRWMFEKKQEDSSQLIE